MDEYKIDDIKDTMDETGEVPERIYFFYGGDSQQFVDALEFIRAKPYKYKVCCIFALKPRKTDNDPK